MIFNLAVMDFFLNLVVLERTRYQKIHDINQAENKKLNWTLELIELNFKVNFESNLVQLIWVLLHNYSTISTQVSPEILTQGKNRQMAANFLKANFEYFRVLTARGMLKNRTVQALFQILWNCVLNFAKSA